MTSNINSTVSTLERVLQAQLYQHQKNIWDGTPSGVCYETEKTPNPTKDIGGSNNPGGCDEAQKAYLHYTEQHPLSHADQVKELIKRAEAPI